MTNRFFATCLDKADDVINGTEYYGLNLAISQTSDPFGAWYHWREQFNTGPFVLLDQPSIAVTANRIHLHYLKLDPPQNRTYYRIFDLNSALLGISTVVDAPQNSPYYETLCKKHASNDGKPQYMVSAPFVTIPGQSCTSIKLYAFVDNFTIPASIVSINVPIQEPYYYQPAPVLTEPPPGTILSIGGGAELLSTIHVNDELWIVHHTSTATGGISQNPRSVVQWHRILPNNWPAAGATPTIESGRIDEGGGIHSYLPSVATDGTSVVISYLRSGVAHPIEIRRVARALSGGAFGTPVSVGATGIGMWGNQSIGHYSDVDPDRTTPGSFWCHFELPNNNKVALDLVRQFTLP